MKWRDLPKQQILPYVGYFCNLGGFLHSADAAVGMTKWGTPLRIRPLFLKCFTLPRGSLISLAHGASQLPHRGSFCTVSCGTPF